MSSTSEPIEFQGTARYQVRAFLGQGGFGRVYEALDTQLGRTVAVKTLQRMSPRHLLQFKTEFRALADFVHPNVVALYELLSQRDLWFFTMERVRGEPLLQHVGASTSRGEAPKTWIDSADTISGAQPFEEPSPGDGPTSLPLDAAPADFARIRLAFRQIADGVSAIHEAGMVHRDLKPSNVLVTPSGRAVILDFGLVAVPDARGGDDIEVGGTPGYMAPEQASAGPTGPAADWYAFGATLYEAIAGRRPFEGATSQILWSQLHTVPADPRSVAPGVPDDLAELALALLARDPELRPDGPAVLRALGGQARVPWHRAAFVGRSDEQRALTASAEAVAPGRAVVAFVVGAPGIGKSMLVRQFIDELRAHHPDTLVFEGRCYERESVPFKALDDLVDRIGRHVRGLDPAARERLGDLTDLARLFPALGDAGPAPQAEAREVRRRAAATLRDLLRKLAEVQPVVLSIDDVQWGDADSAEILEEVLAPPDAPGVLLVVTCRGEGVDRTLPKALRALDRAGVPVEEVTVGALPASEAERLAALLVGSGPRAARLARESGGHPFVLTGLVRDESATGQYGSAAQILEDQQLLRAVASAGRPVSRDLVRAASGIEDDDAPLARLRVQHLVRATGTPGNETLEPWHDRIRESVTGALGDRRTAVHARWAEVLEGADPEWRLLHHREAGQRDQAAICALQAAEHAEKALAFHHAAELYREAIALGGVGLEDRLAECLVSCGRAPEAAEAWLAAADRAEGRTALQHRRRAAEQLLLAGIADRGRAVAAQALAPLGMRIARWSWAAALSLAWNRTLLAAGGLRFVAHDRADPDLLFRIDSCWSIASAMSLVDTLRAYDFQAQQTRLSLKAGDPWRASRALALEASYLGISGPPVRARCKTILAQARALAEPLAEPRAVPFVDLCEAIVAYLGGDLVEAIPQHEAAEAALRARCRDVNWELSAAVTMQIDARMRLGRWGELYRGLPAIGAEARHTGNRYVASFVAFVRGQALLLGEDRPDQAEEAIAEFFPSPAMSQPTIQDWWGHHAPAIVQLYRGNAGAALERLDGHWTAVLLSGLPLVRLLASTMFYARGVATVSVARESSGWRRTRALWRAHRYASRLQGLRMPAADAMALLVRGSVAAVQGDAEGALARFTEAEAASEAVDHRLFAAAARRRRGQLLGGDTGGALVIEADARMRAEGIQRPDRIAEIYAPLP